MVQFDSFFPNGVKHVETTFLPKETTIAFAT